MKKEYVTPECDFIKFKLTIDILGDSQPEPTDNPIYNETIPDDPFA